MPSCRRLEPVLETLNGELASASAESAAGGGGGSSKAGGGSGGAPLPNFCLRKFNAEESRMMRDRYNVQSLPMFLMYYGGRLAYAGNTLNGYGTSRDDMVAQARETLDRAQRGQFLPEGFKFGITDDSTTAKFADVLAKEAPSLKAGGP